MEGMAMATCARRWQRTRSSSRACLLLFFLAICAGWPLASFAQEPTGYGGGMGVFLEPGAGQQRDPDQQHIFQVAPGTPLRATFGFDQSYPETKTFRVFFLLNYEQFAIGYQQIPTPDWDATPVATSSTVPTGPLHPLLEFSIEPEVERYYTIWTEPLPAGYYDLVLIVVPDPYQNQRELPYFTYLQLSLRASVYVGVDPTPPPLEYPLFDPESVIDGESAGILWFGQESHKAGLKRGQAVTAGQAVTLIANYRVSLGSGADNLPADTPVPVAIVGILDDRVVPINGQAVWYGSAIPGRLNYLPVTVEAPDEPGTHQLFLQQFPNPYTDVAEAEATGRSDVGMSSQRFILDVE
jgi:hypothetical protein